MEFATAVVFIVIIVIVTIIGLCYRTGWNRNINDRELPENIL